MRKVVQDQRSIRTILKKQQVTLANDKLNDAIAGCFPKTSAVESLYDAFNIALITFLNQELRARVWPPAFTWRKRPPLGPTQQ